MTATTETFAVADGVLNLDFSARNPGGLDQSKVSAIEVLGQSAATAPPVASAGPVQDLTLPATSAALTGDGGAGAPGATVAAYAWAQASGPAGAPATFSPNTAVAAPTVSGLAPGTYVFALVVTDNLGTPSAPSTTTVTVNPPLPAGGSRLASFTLVSTGTGPDLQPLADGAVLNLAALPAAGLNVRANTNPAAVGSVVFTLSGAQARTQTETTAPYALFGDANGSYAAWIPAVGSYKLTATPYAGPGGTGAAGTALTVNFTVVQQAAATAAAKHTPPVVVPDLTVAEPPRAYPNPSADGRFTVALPAARAGEVTYALMSATGAVLIQGTRPREAAALGLAFDFSAEMQAPGVYYLRLVSPGPTL
ncbi:PKD domain-containing protein [Hymenobacter nivis]|uniref:T9SS C-terminal target domain-containing protein n=1 Tax=Hymenobacter nivis TaxID=1850093 RepID=A0A2Z3GEC8_9BACT|nr:hypothetical protein [Hymenobacter nivis]AWM32029.1 hypothetical protein DDQ68_03990 [Hymenobacter nivis]